jgi:hypothetical protein
MSQPIVANKVKSETIIIPKGDTFEMRWLPKYDDGSKRVRTIPIRAATKEIEKIEVHEDDVKEVSRVSARPSVAPSGRNLDAPNDLDVSIPPHRAGQQRQRRMKIAYVYKRDQRTCLRHDMKTVYYGKHRWRCRR